MNIIYRDPWIIRPPRASFLRTLSPLNLDTGDIEVLDDTYSFFIALKSPSLPESYGSWLIQKGIPNLPDEVDQGCSILRISTPNQQTAVTTPRISPLPEIFHTRNGRTEYRNPSFKTYLIVPAVLFLGISSFFSRYFTLSWRFRKTFQ